MYKVTVADFAFYQKKKVGRAFEDNFFRGGGGWVGIFKSLNAREGDIKL